MQTMKPRQTIALRMAVAALHVGKSEMERSVMAAWRSNELT